MDTSCFLKILPWSILILLCLTDGTAEAIQSLLVKTLIMMNLLGFDTVIPWYPGLGRSIHVIHKITHPPMNFAEHHQRPLVEALLHWSPAKVSKDETGKHVLLDLENTGLKTISEDIRSVTPSLHLSILLSLFLYPIPSKSVLRIGRCSHLHCSYILLSSMQKPLPKSVQIRVSYHFWHGPTPCSWRAAFGCQAQYQLPEPVTKSRRFTKSRVTDLQHVQIVQQRTKKSKSHPKFEACTPVANGSRVPPWPTFAPEPSFPWTWKILAIIVEKMHWWSVGNCTFSGLEAGHCLQDLCHYILAPDPGFLAHPSSSNTQRQWSQQHCTGWSCL